VDALEVLKRRRKSGLPESSVMVLLAIQGPCRAGDVANITGIYGRILQYALKDAVERGWLKSEGYTRRVTYSRTPDGDRLVTSCFQNSSAFKGNHGESR